MCANQIAGGQDLVQVIAADHMAEQHDPRQQAQPPRAGDHQRHVGAASCVGTVMPVADQQEREEAGQLPEKHDLDQVAGNHQSEHGAHERQEKCEEPRHRIVRRHVIACVQRDQCADAQHQHRKQPREPVHAQDEVQAEAWQPEEFFADYAAMGDLRVQERDLDGADQCDQAREQGGCIACVVRQDGCQTAANKWQKQ